MVAPLFIDEPAPHAAVLLSCKSALAAPPHALRGRFEPYVSKTAPPKNSADRLYINAAENRLCINTAGVLSGQLPCPGSSPISRSRIGSFPDGPARYAASRGSLGLMERFCRAVGSIVRYFSSTEYFSQTAARSQRLSMDSCCGAVKYCFF